MCPQKKRAWQKLCHHFRSGLGSHAKSFSPALPVAVVTQACQAPREGMWTPSLADIEGDPRRTHRRRISVAATFWKCNLLQSPNQALGYGVGYKPRDSGNSGVLVGLLASLVTGSREPKWDHSLFVVFLGSVVGFGVWMSQLCVLSPETVKWIEWKKCQILVNIHWLSEVY